MSRRNLGQNASLVAASALLVDYVLTVAVSVVAGVAAITRVVAIPLVFWLMNRIHPHYRRVDLELTPRPEGVTLPSRIHGVVPVARLQEPTLRAIAFARATRPHDLTAVTVQVDADETHRLMREWNVRRIPVPLKVLESPFREITRPLLDYVRDVHRASPRDVVCVFIPEYVVSRWWEHLLHNQSALRLKARLLFVPGVMVTSIPWQLHPATADDGSPNDEGSQPPSYDGLARSLVAGNGGAGRGSPS